MCGGTGGAPRHLRLPAPPDERSGILGPLQPIFHPHAGQSHLDGTRRLHHPESSAGRRKRPSSRPVGPISTLRPRKSTPANARSAITTHRGSRMRLPCTHTPSSSVLGVWSGSNRTAPVPRNRADFFLLTSPSASRADSSWSNPDAPMNGPARFRPSSRAMTGGRNVEQRPWPCRGRREPEMAASAPVRSRKRAAPFGWPAKGAAIDHDGRRRPGGRQR